MSKASRLAIVAAALAALGLANARAATDQAAPTNESSSATEPLQEVTVTAQRAKLAQRITAFVSKITGPQFAGGLPRWGAPVCPLVSGLSQEQGEFIVGRVSEIARTGGVPLAGEECLPNLYILVTTQPQELLKAMAKRNFQFTFGISTEPMDGTPIVPSHVVIDEFISNLSITHILSE